MGDSWRSIKEFFITKSRKNSKLKPEDACGEPIDESTQCDQLEELPQTLTIPTATPDDEDDFDRPMPPFVCENNIANANNEEIDENLVEMQCEEDICNSEPEEEDFMEFSECPINTNIVNNGDLGPVCLKSCLKSKARCAPKQVRTIHVTWSPDVKETTKQGSFKRLVEKQHARQKEKALLRSKKNFSLYRKSAAPNNHTSIMKNYGAISLSPYFGCELFSGSDIPLF